MSYIVQEEEFNTITIQHTREMLKNAYDAVNYVEAWDWLKTFNEESFMLSQNPLIWKITEAMEKLGYTGHSGYSFGYTMRAMEFLAKHGKDNFLIHYAKSSPY